MEFSGKKWQLRLLAGLLAVFVALYFMTDLFGRSSAEDDPLTVGESQSEDAGELDGVEGEGEDENGIDPLAEDYGDEFFHVENVSFVINGRKVAPGETVYAKTGDSVTIAFDWAIKNIDESGWQGSETFTYEDFGSALGNIRIPESKFLSGNFNVGNDGTGRYEIETDGSGVIGALRITISSNTGTFNHQGTINLEGKVSVSGDATQSNTIGLGDWSCILKNSAAYPNLNVYKETKNEPIYYENGNYYQNFYVTVNNFSDTVDATEVLLTDRYSENFAYRSLELRGATLNGSAVSLPEPIRGQNETEISVGTIPAKGKLELAYRLKVDNPKSSLSVSGSDFKNKISASCKELDQPAEDEAWGWYEAPGVSKSGAYLADSNEISWTITVKPGVLKDDSELDFTVTEVPGTNLSASDVTAALGKLTLTKADLGAPDANGNYTLTFKTPAPERTSFEQKVKNKVDFKIFDGSYYNAGEVTVPAEGKAIHKTYDEVRQNGENGIVIPWRFTVDIPSEKNDPKDVITDLSISDESKTPNNGSYGGQKDRLAIDYASLKVEVGGNTYTAKNVPAIDSDEYISGNIRLSDSAGNPVPFELSLWYNQNIQFGLNVVGSDTEKIAWIKTLRGKSVSVSYDMYVNSTEDDIITKIENTVEVKLNNEDTIRDTAVYQKSISVGKGENWWPRGIDGANGISDWDARSGIKGWTVKVYNNSDMGSDSVTLKDTLPEGYHLLSGVIQAELKAANGTTIGKLQNSGITVSIPTRYQYSEANNGAGNEIFQAVIALGSLSDSFKKGAYLEISYAGDLDTDYMNAKTNNGNTQHTFTLKNTAQVTVGSDTAVTSFTTSVQLPSNPTLLKSFSGTPSRVGNRLEATYVLNVNQGGRKQNEGKPLTLTDTLGTKLDLVGNSVVIRKQGESGRLVDVTAEVGYQEGTTGEGNDTHTTLTFTLDDETYYQIEYKVTSSELLDNDVLNPEKVKDYIRDGVFSADEIDAFKKSTGIQSAEGALKKVIEQELENSYGNSASLSGKTSYGTALTLSSDTFRLTTGYSYTFRITGEKIWPAGDTPPSEVVLKLTETKTYVPKVAEALGKKTEEAYTYYHLLFNGSARPDSTINGSRHVYIPISAAGDNPWSFTTDYLSIEDLAGSTYFYTLEEEKQAGYFPTYIFDPAKGQGMTTQDGSEFHINGSVHVQVKNQRKETNGELILRKSDNTVSKSPLTGAEFKLTTKNADMTKVTVTPSDAVAANREKKELTLTVTEADGITLSNLPMGDYTLTETKAPKGYVRNKQSYTFTVEKNGAVQAKSNGDYLFTGQNTPILTLQDRPTELSVKKTDMTGMEQLAGAELTIKNTDETPLGSVTVTGAEETKTVLNGDTLTFTTTNTTATVKGLPAGKYILTEKIAPSGYAVITTGFEFMIGEDGTVTAAKQGENTLSGTEITLKDDLTGFTLEKTDRDDPTLLLEGAEFEIKTAASNGANLKLAPISVKDVNGNAIITENTVVFTTAAKSAVITGLPAGDYTLTEKTPPTKYRSVGQPISFTVGKDGKLENVDGNKLTVENERITGEITLKKTDEDGQPLSGAELTLTADGEIDWSRVERDGNALSGTGGTSYSFTTGADPTKFTGLPVGSYTLAETKAPNGYLTTAEFSFKVTAPDGTVETSDQRYKAGTATLVDKTAAPGTIEIIKQNADNGALLAGAEFEITLKNNGEFGAYTANDNSVTLSADKKTLSFTTNNRQAVRISGLAAGTYVIREKKAPDGYIMAAAEKEITLTLSADGNAVSSASVSFKNAPTEIKINKLDITGTKQLAGAELTIKNTDGTPLGDVTVTGAKETNPVPNGDTLTFTTTNTTATVKGLPAGNYILTEKIAPSGYVVTTKFTFSIGKDGTVTGEKKQGDNTRDGKEITLFDRPTEIAVKKVDMTDGAKQLPGALLKIESKDGADLSKVTAEGISGELLTTNSSVSFTTGDTEAILRGLPAGRYVLTETVAPEHYAKTETSFSFEIKSDGTVTASTNTTTTPTGGAEITLGGDKKTITVENAPLSIIKILKKFLDEDGNPVSPNGVLLATKFGLFRDGNCTDRIGDEVSPNEAGEVIFPEIGNGTYFVKEIQSPTGFKKDESVYRCVVLNGTVTYTFNGKNFTSPTYTNISTTTVESSSSSEGTGPTGTSPTGTSPTGTGPTGTGPTGTSPTGTAPVITYPIGSRPNITTTTRKTTTTTTTRVTTTEPDEVEPEETTARTTKKPTDTTTVPKETTEKSTTTTTTPAVTAATTTESDGSEIDANRHTNDEENPPTGTAFTSLGALVAAGMLAAITGKKRKKQ